MPYTEIINTHPTQPTERYALCDKPKCIAAFGSMFGIPDMTALPVTVDKDTYTSERIFEDSNTHHANCFMCGGTVWCGADCSEED